MTERIPLILDVDTGIDDAAAIALAVLSPEADLLSISTVAGNTTIDRATRNTLDVLSLLGAADIPVYQGASRPLVRTLFTAERAHGNNGVGGAELPRSSRLPGEYRGPASMVRHARERPGEITLVCVGPLTNLAIALNVEPDLPKLLKRVVIMGGAFWIPGNIGPDYLAEFNFYVDPEAAQQVLDADFPEMYLVGLDVTHRAPVSQQMWSAIQVSNSVAAEMIYTIYRSRVENPETGQAYIHDAMAVAAALDRNFITWERTGVEMEIDDRHRGRSKIVSDGGLFVARTVDTPMFVTRFYDRLGIVDRSSTP